jgi:hypothetical protein
MSHTGARENHQSAENSYNLVSKGTIAHASKPNHKCNTILQKEISWSASCYRSAPVLGAQQCSQILRPTEFPSPPATRILLRPRTGALRPSVQRGGGSAQSPVAEAYDSNDSSDGCL